MTLIRHYVREFLRESSPLPPNVGLTLKTGAAEGDVPPTDSTSPEIQRLKATNDKLFASYEDVIQDVNYALTQFGAGEVGNTLTESDEVARAKGLAYTLAKDSDADMGYPYRAALFLIAHNNSDTSINDYMTRTLTSAKSSADDLIKRVDVMSQEATIPEPQQESRRSRRRLLKENFWTELSLHLKAELILGIFHALQASVEWGTARASVGMIDYVMSNYAKEVFSKPGAVESLLELASTRKDIRGALLNVKLTELSATESKWVGPLISSLNKLFTTVDLLGIIKQEAALLQCVERINEVLRREGKSPILVNETTLREAARQILNDFFGADFKKPTSVKDMKLILRARIGQIFSDAATGARRTGGELAKQLSDNTAELDRLTRAIEDIEAEQARIEYTSSVNPSKATELRPRLAEIEKEIEKLTVKKSGVETTLRYIEQIQADTQGAREAFETIGVVNDRAATGSSTSGAVESVVQNAELSKQTLQFEDLFAEYLYSIYEAFHALVFSIGKWMRISRKITLAALISGGLVAAAYSYFIPPDADLTQVDNEDLVKIFTIANIVRNAQTSFTAMEANRGSIYDIWIRKEISLYPGETSAQTAKEETEYADDKLKALIFKKIDVPSSAGDIKSAADAYNKALTAANEDEVIVGIMAGRK